MTEIIVLKDVPEETQCHSCAGCGYVANDDDKTPWKYWMDVPLKSALAVQMGLVVAVECEDCNGTGSK